VTAVVGPPRRRWRDVVTLLREPDAFLSLHFEHERPMVTELFTWFLPALLVRPIAVLLRSFLMDLPSTALVLAASSFLLQLGAWLAVGSLLPVLARQLETQLGERDGVLLTGFASIPLWLAGALFIVPETVPWGFWSSRMLVFVLALYGAFIAFRATIVLGAPHESRGPLVAAFAATYTAVYAMLFVLIGLSSHLVLWALGATAS
jgi:hypothetical protein